MDTLEWIRVGCAVLGGVLVLWVECKSYRDRMRAAKQPWWQDGTHDEVRTWR